MGSRIDLTRPDVHRSTIVFLAGVSSGGRRCVVSRSHLLLPYVHADFLLRDAAEEREADGVQVPRRWSDWVDDLSDASRRESWREPVGRHLTKSLDERLEPIVVVQGAVVGHPVGCAFMVELLAARVSAGLATADSVLCWLDLPLDETLALARVEEPGVSRPTIEALRDEYALMMQGQPFRRFDGIRACAAALLELAGESPSAGTATTSSPGDDHGNGPSSKEIA